MRHLHRTDLRLSRRNDRALDWLERAYRMRDSSIMNVIDEPLLKSLADDPRYQAFVRDKLKVPRQG